jgi:hypothetical protein
MNRAWMADQEVADSLPPPGRKLITPAGTPASSSSATKRAAISGVTLAGFRIAVLPVTSAAAVMPTVIAHGKFQGGMTTPTPSGW